MKTISSLIISLFVVLISGIPSPAIAQEPVGQGRVDTEIKVLGICGMCKDRIERAAFSVRGVRSASWDQKQQLLTVNFRADRTSQEEIERSIAKAGHDTEHFITDEETYSNLHSCCKYPRDPEMLRNNKLYNQE
ncbi:MAG: heavy-metal-associated domain-containing protein [Bacteroidales bacterium]|jgi:copper chaperone CopZ|nr:heavy-metal-associated domain-containing protein [Bacteroidales bacterium]NLM92845.1 heavy-metal-associated domain-containing protein [Bacteroidales bacterium]